MLFSIHNKTVINLIRENDQLVFSCEVYNLLQYFLRIKSTGRIVWIDDNDRFCTVVDLLTHIFDIRIPDAFDLDEINIYFQILSLHAIAILHRSTQSKLQGNTLSCICSLTMLQLDLIVECIYLRSAPDGCINNLDRCVVCLLHIW